MAILSSLTTFVARNTRITADWLNRVDQTIVGLQYNVKGYGATGDGTTDDTAAIQAAVDACGQAGGGVVFFPPGNYKVDSITAVAGLRWAIGVAYDNITFRGATGARVFTTSNAAPFSVCGWLKPGDPSNWPDYNIVKMIDGDTGLHDLTGSYSKGAVSIQLASEADAANYAAGEIIYIRTGQTLGGSAIDNPDSELNQVRSVSGDTINLMYPLSKPYAAEKYVSGSSGITSTTGAGDSAPFGVANVTDRVLRNIAFENLEIDGSTNTSVSLFGMNGVWGFRVTGCTISAGAMAISQGNVREQWVTHNTFHLVGANFTFNWPWAVSVGCTHGWFTDNDVSATQRVAQVHVHEGPASFTIARNRLHSTPTAADVPTVDIRARAYDIVVDDNDIVNGGNSAAIYIDGYSKGGGRITNNRVRGSSFATALAINAEGWYEGKNDFGILHGIRANNADTRTNGHPPDEIKVLKCWLADDVQTAPLGWLPGFATILRAHITVNESFNSDGTDQITIGYSLNTDAYAEAIDASTTGYKSITPGSDIGLYSETGRLVNAYYVNGGSEPTTGKALCVVEYIDTGRRVA